MLGKPPRLDRAEATSTRSATRIQTDPRNIARRGGARAAPGADPKGAPVYLALPAFIQRWTAAIAKWDKDVAPLKGTLIVVQHKAFTYLEAWLGLREVAALEPKPGIEPTTAHLASVVEVLQREPAKMVLRAAYQSDRASQWIAERAGLKAVALPFTVGGTEGAKDLFGLFDDTIQRLLKAAA